MHHAVSSLRSALLIGGAVLLAGCAAKDPLSQPAVPLGDFSLGYTIVVADDAKLVPPSRSATAEEWESVLKAALERRFARYEGDKLYHFGVNVDGYALAVPGVPVIASPKSILVVSANVWDDAAGEKLNAEVEQLSVFEDLTGDSVIGTGLTRSKQEQMHDLADNMARRIERWLVENREDWFGFDPEAPAADAPVAPAASGVPAESISQATLGGPETDSAAAN
ncbi:hypothetical protein SAMN05444722_3072 [Rhodovulum sp. ES.010]|uniref:hypothetical protein n=1 Tax=Rhodovulum sp. ES.010 TaxID=1882821 RepID=UPI000928D35C|nr:hypothetical protein [Rhodovulum sp. ES.010]SIO52433.1 hypothetical protein SAMN05444722_3072 [Rhodovulum sp. ES.010]